MSERAMRWAWRPEVLERAGGRRRRVAGRGAAADHGARRGHGLEPLEPRLLLAINPMTPVAGIQGEPAPSISLSYITGAPFTIEAVNQPILVMDFWASWCGPCMAALPLLHDFDQWVQANNKPVEVVAVNTGENAATAAAAWVANGFTLPIVMDPGYIAFNAYASIYNNNGIPFTVMVAGGRITAHHVGYSPTLNQMLQAEVNALLPLLPQESGEPEIGIEGNGRAIPDGQSAASGLDGTAFGIVDIGGALATRTFTIRNDGSAPLALSADPRVQISGAQASDFRVTQQPPATIAAGASATFMIQFDPGATGLRTATVRIANDDPDESPYNFAIEGVGTDQPLPDIAIEGNGLAIADGDTTPDAADHTEFGNVELDGGTATRTFTIRNEGTAPLSLTADPPVQLGGAYPEDFAIVSQPASSVAPGESTSFTVRFDPQAAGPRRASLVIESNDPDEGTSDFAIRGSGAQLPRLTVGDARAAEGNDGERAVSFLVSLSAASADTVRVAYTVEAGTATEGLDYVPTSGQVLFAPGQTARSILVTMAGDTAIEPDETFVLRLADPLNAVLEDDRAEGVIENDDFPRLSIADAQVIEGDEGTRYARFDVSLSGPSPQAVTVDYATGHGSAGPDDYVGASGTLLLAPGETEGDIVVAVGGDRRVEHDETFRVRLRNARHALVEVGEAQGTIVNDDYPTLFVEDLAVGEGDLGTLGAVVSVRLSVPGLEPITVDYATADDTATAPQDYTQARGSLLIPPGQVTGQAAITIRGDRRVEADETLRFDILAASHATIGRGTGRLTIVDDDVPEASIGDLAIEEGDGGTADALFTVSLSQPPLRPVSIQYATADGYATAPADYAASSGTLTLAAGQTTATISVPVAGDTRAEWNETFFLMLNAATNATIADAMSQAIIVDQDGIGVTVGQGGARAVAFTDADGTRATVAVRAGTAQVRFVGEQLERRARGSTVVVSGRGVRLAEIELAATTSDPVVSIGCRGGDGRIVLGNITAPWSVDAILAPQVDLAGGIEVGQVVRRIVLHDLLPDSRILAGPAPAARDALVLQFHAATDATLEAGGAVRSIRGSSWLDVNATVERIQAASLGEYAIEGESAVSLDLAGPVAGGPVLGRAAVGRLTGGHWAIDGDGGRIAAGSIGDAWSARFSGSLGELAVDADASGDLEAQSVGRIRVGRNLTDARITLSGPGGPRGLALERLTVGGLVRAVDLDSAAGVGTIAGALFLESVFDVLGAVENVLVNGRRGAPQWITDTNFSAVRFGHIEVGFAGSSQGDAYGFTAQGYGDILYRGPAGRLALPAGALAGAGETLLDADLVIRVL